MAKLMDPSLGMGVEVKLRPPNSDVHQKVLSLLSPLRIQTIHQRSVFFDGAAGELSSQKVSLFLRFFENSQAPKCFICMKAKAVIVDGVSRVEQDVEYVDYETGFKCVEDPARLGFVDAEVVRRAKEEFGVGRFSVLGGYENVRNVYEWNGLKLEVDETVYEFGRSYEIECESEEPEKAKKMIERLLNENGIDYSYSEMSKFSIFKSGQLPYNAVEHVKYAKLPTRFGVLGFCT